LNTLSPSHQITLEPNDIAQLANLCGPFDTHLRQIESRLGVVIKNRGNNFHLTGNEDVVFAAGEVINRLYKEVGSGDALTSETVHLFLQDSEMDSMALGLGEELILIKKKSVKPRGLNQQNYVKAIRTNDINFGLGPAGTGKTYLAVACAVEALEQEKVRRILLVRPAVEAGEKLGFLPGDLAQKIDPYLRPLYDALYEMMGFEKVGKLIERNIIEVAPLAYMRGRTLNNAFIILDESQNTTMEQMKMFLTRVGFGSTVVVTGDASQIDLPMKSKSGLRHCLKVLQNVKGISFTTFSPRDVVRHPLVQRIVEAYEQFESDDTNDN